MSKESRSKSAPDQSERDELKRKGVLLPGWPGYRTREGRSGYDPIDNRTEAAHTAGALLRRLFTGRYRNPISLLLLGALGLVLVIPILLAISELANGNPLPWNAWLFFLIIGALGFAILANFMRNLMRILLR
jgi:hypothetical protein